MASIKRVLTEPDCGANKTNRWWWGDDNNSAHLMWAVRGENLFVHTGMFGCFVGYFITSYPKRMNTILLLRLIHFFKVERYDWWLNMSWRYFHFPKRHCVYLIFLLKNLYHGNLKIGLRTLKVNNNNYFKMFNTKIMKLY